MIRFLVNIPTELHAFLRKTAGKQGQTLNGLVRQILWDWAERQGELNTNRHFDEGREGVGVYQHNG